VTTTKWSVFNIKDKFPKDVSIVACTDNKKALQRFCCQHKYIYIYIYIYTYIGVIVRRAIEYI